MPDLRHQLEAILKGRVCLVGVGNVDWGDDGLGMRLAEAFVNDECRMTNDEWPSKSSAGDDSSFVILLAGSHPERHLPQLADGGFDHVLFLDAVEFGGAPGSVVLLDAAGMAGRLPQVSTHKLSLGLLAKWIEANGRTKAWLLGVQPESLTPGAGLSAAVRISLELLVGLFRNAGKPRKPQTSRSRHTPIYVRSRTSRNHDRA